MAVPDIPIRHEIFHVECLSEADFSFLNCCQSSSTVFKKGAREQRIISSWQNCTLVQVRHMETHHRPHQRAQGAAPVSGTGGSFYCWQTPEEPGYGPARSVSPRLCVRARGCQTRRCQLSRQLKRQSNLHPSPRLPPGRCPWNHAWHNLWPGGGGLDSCFLTPENDKRLRFKSARFAKPG